MNPKCQFLDKNSLNLSHIAARSISIDRKNRSHTGNGNRIISQLPTFLSDAAIFRGVGMTVFCNAGLDGTLIYLSKSSSRVKA